MRARTCARACHRARSELEEISCKQRIHRTGHSVWSTAIRWFHPSPSFVNFIEPGASLGFDSLALAAHEGRTLADQMEEVPAEAWIKSSWLKEDAVVSEQSIFMPSYEGCLSLIWIRRAIEQKPTVEDELLPELDPEGFTVNRKRWPR